MVTPLSRIIDPDSIIFDVGGHAGQFAKLFAKLAPVGHVYSFEPGSYALSILKLAVQFNRLRNITVIPFGLGDEETQVELTVPIKPSGSVGFGLSHVEATNAKSAATARVGWNYRQETISITTIDQFVQAEGIDRVDFIKADIEGWEMRMLLGAKLTLARHHPSLMIEAVDEHLARAGDSSSTLFNYLSGFGYRAFKLDASLEKFIEIAQPEETDLFFVSDELARLL